MLRRVDRLIFRVPNLESAVRYYRDALHLTLNRQDRTVASFFLADGATELVLHTDADQPAEQIYYLVDDVRDLYRRRDELRLRFVQSPQQASRGYRAAVKDPFGNILLLIDRTTEASAAAAIEDARVTKGVLFAGIEAAVPPRRDALIKAYVAVGRTADDLPYTPHFEKLYADYCAQYGQTKPSRQETWRHLLNLRKGGKLPKLGEARSEPPEVSEDAHAELRLLLGEDIGRRDRLPYSEKFDQLVESFNRTQPRPLSPHLIWRLAAKLAK
jgi:catechol 2,3-dioxygenase-like lactoylglutathione lyase family enzyme